MTTITTTELAAIAGGQCYSFDLSKFGLNVAIHFGSCDMK